MRVRNTFSKSQRLKSRKKLQQLFTGNNAVFAGNVKLLFLTEDSEPGFVKCGVGSAGRYFKKAVDRNRIKRLLREAYRLQQQELGQFSEQQKKEISVFILYTGKKMPDYSELYNNVGSALQKILKTLQSPSLRAERKQGGEAL